MVIYGTQRNIEDLLAIDASRALILDLFPDVNRSRLQSWARNAGGFKPNRRPWTHARWEKEHNKVDFSRLIDEVIKQYDDWFDLVSTETDQTMLIERSAAIHVLHYQAHYGRPEVQHYFTTDGIYSILAAHQRQESCKHICRSCKQAYWSLSVRHTCPHCYGSDEIPTIEQVCRSCGEVFTVIRPAQQPGRPRIYCDPCRIERNKKKTKATTALARV